MPVSKENMKAIGLISGIADNDWLAEMKRRKMFKNEGQWRYGGGDTFMIADEIEKEIGLVPERGIDGIKIYTSQVEIPNTLKVLGGPHNILLGSGISLNPAGLLPSTALTPTPAFIIAPDPQRGLLGPLTSILGAL